MAKGRRLVDNGFTMKDWSLLFCVLFRKEAEYRTMGKAGFVLWSRLKMMLYLHSLGMPCRVYALLEDLNVEPKTGAAVVAALIKDKKVKVLGYSEEAKDDKDLGERVIELSIEGMMEAEELLLSCDNSLKLEIASQEGRKLLGYYG